MAERFDVGGKEPPRGFETVGYPEKALDVPRAEAVVGFPDGAPKGIEGRVPGGSGGAESLGRMCQCQPVSRELLGLLDEPEKAA